MATNSDERWDLARLVNRTQCLLHHQLMRRTLTQTDVDALFTLTPLQTHMVMTVREQGQVTIKQLAQTLCVGAPAASAMVDRLVEMGILTREANPNDRREVLVRVSPREESEIQAMERRHLQHTVDLFDKIGLDCARMWGELCVRIQNVLDDERS